MPKPPDYPAAHSMDTTWFAVDADGVVAEFNTDEDGALPNAAFTGDSLEDDEELWAAVENRLQVEGAGVVRYRRDFGEAPGAYTHLAVPKRPVWVQDLEPAFAAQVSQLRLPVRFAEAPKLQLADHMADEDASFWGEDWTLRGFGEPKPGPPPNPGRSRLLYIVLGLLALIPIFVVITAILLLLVLKPVAAP